MKYKLTLVLLLTVILLGGGIWETVYVSKTFTEFDTKLEKIMAKEEYTLEEVEDLSEWWEKKSESLEITIPHTQLNEITVTIGELVGAVKKEDYDSASALLVRISEYSERINHMYSFLINNIV